VRWLILPLYRAADGILSVLLAPRCLSCDLPLDFPLRGPVCGACWQAIAPIAPVCARCGDAVPGWGSDTGAAALCPRCRRTPGGSVAAGRSAGRYDGTLRCLLHALKYEGRRSLAPALARLMRDRGAAVLAGSDIVVPVPLHWRRRWGRGFNQAEDLAIHLGLPVARALVRRRATPPQVGLPAARRHRNVRGAFAPRRRLWGRVLNSRVCDSRHDPRVKGKVVVLVDDVATTGATLEACGEVLRRMGAKEVRALTAARAPVRLLQPR